MPLANVDFGCGIAWSDEMTGGGPEFVVAGGYNNPKGDVFVYSLKHNSWRRGRSNLELIDIFCFNLELIDIFCPPKCCSFS